MKTLLMAGAFALAGTMAMADPAEGLWQTGVDHGSMAHVQIRPCGARLCGQIKRTFDAKGNETKSPTIGKSLFWDMAAQGGGSYGGGKIWQPATGKTYDSRMTVSGSSLTIKGCVGPICGSQIWKRLK